MMDVDQLFDRHSAVPSVCIWCVQAFSCKIIKFLERRIQKEFVFRKRT